MNAWDPIERLCVEKGLRMTPQRRVIARVLVESEDHPDVVEVHRRAARVIPRICAATVYRTVRLFEEANIVERHVFRDGRARYKKKANEHHDHLIDVETGDIIEFQNDEIQRMQREIADKLGYDVVDHRMELYGVVKKSRWNKAS